MNQHLLGAVLEPDTEEGYNSMSVVPEEFAKDVIAHFGRPIPVQELEVPILQTSETEQVREPCDPPPPTDLATKEKPGLAQWYSGGDSVGPAQVQTSQSAQNLVICAKKNPAAGRVQP